MDKELNMYLKRLDFTNDDINEICSIAPGLDIIDSERAFKNISVVVQYGYPEVDIDSLIFSNPAFMCNDPEYLKVKLSKLGGDIEEKLKADPFLI